MVDADKTWTNFLKECLAAPSLCAIANATGPATTVESLDRAIGQVFHELYESQQTIPFGIGAISYQAGLAPVSLYEKLKREIFMSLYFPALLPGLAETLAVVLTRNFTVWETVATPATDPAAPVATPYNAGYASFWGVACSDSAMRASRPEDIFKDVAQQQASSSFADAYLPQLWTCPAWRFEPAERFENTTTARTKNPILFVNSAYDPITPMIAAEKGVARFEGSALLRTTGHGVSHFALCFLLSSQAVRWCDDLNSLIPHVLARHVRSPVYLRYHRRPSLLRQRNTTQPINDL